MHDIGINGSALQWFRYYLKDCITSIKVDRYVSASRDVVYGIPQGSVPGLALFNIYCIPLGHVIRMYNISYYMYADDTQLYMNFVDSEENTNKNDFIS